MNYYIITYILIHIINDKYLNNVCKQALKAEISNRWEGISGKHKGGYMFTIFLYTFTIAILIFYFYKDSNKTKQAVQKGLKSFLNILPEFLTVLLIIGITLSLLSPEIISKLISPASGIWGIFISSIIGAITLIPGFVAFPLAKALLDYGAGLVPIAAFVSSLMMVGVVTLPLEIKYFGKKATITRNILAYIYSIAIALLMGALPWIY